MKKVKKSKSFLNWISDVWLKAALILLIVTGGFYAYAQITWPGDEPNPTTGVVGMFVGESKSVYDSTISGYDKVNSLCSNHTNPALVGSHICTQDEMVNSYNHGQTGISPIFTYTNSTTLWINSGPPGFTSNANDCKGWTKTDSPSSNRNFGRVWNFVDKYGSLLDCKAGKAFACCK